MNNLSRIDLNLLLTLHVLLQERHISRAAARLHKSQPAVSHALARLRELFDDPLLVREGNTLRPSAKAQALQQPLQQALAGLQQVVMPEPFTPAHSQRHFRLAMSDYAATLLLPALLRRLREHAPHITLGISQGSREAMLAAVADGQTDLALGVFPQPPAQVQHEALFEERFVSVADAANLPPGGTLSLQAWLARPHVAVAMRPDMEGEIERALQQRHLRRRIAVSLPHWRVAAELLPGTEFILTIARRSLPPEAQTPRLRRFEPPLPIPPFVFGQIWHPRNAHDPALCWLRAQIADILGNL
ncbi:LysR family transcriptional regulator [Comamonadaceae bacterium OH2545_COT-014]|nr:LysR family transcriptional regulator [Comamonadaceae bacterium OH2545_COT-014]